MNLLLLFYSSVTKTLIKLYIFLLQRPKHKFFSSSTEDPNNCSDHSTLGSSASLDPSTVQNSHGHGQLTGSFSHDASLKVKSTTKQSTRWSGLFSNSLKVENDCTNFF